MERTDKTKQWLYCGVLSTTVISCNSICPASSDQTPSLILTFASPTCDLLTNPIFSVFQQPFSECVQDQIPFHGLHCSHYHSGYRHLLPGLFPWPPLAIRLLPLPTAVRVRLFKPQTGHGLCAQNPPSAPPSPSASELFSGLRVSS